MALSHEDGERVYRYFTGEGVSFIAPSGIIRLCLSPHHDRSWAVHEGRKGFRHLHDPEDKVEIQLLDVLYLNDELHEFTVDHGPLPEDRPKFEMPDFRA